MTLTPESSAEPRFPPEVERVLRENGWFPGRTIATELLQEWLMLDVIVEVSRIQVRMFAAASLSLREFGGLRIKLDLPGITCYRETFVFDPTVICSRGRGYNWLMDECLANGALFPLGYFEQSKVLMEVFNVDSHGQILDEDGRLLGTNIDHALTNMILGFMPNPLEVEDAIVHEVHRLFPMFIKKLEGE